MLKNIRKQIELTQELLEIRIKLWKDLSKTVDDFIRRIDRYKNNKDKNKGKS